MQRKENQAFKATGTNRHVGGRGGKGSALVLMA